MSREIKEYNKLPKKIKDEISLLNDLNGSEWTHLSKSINVFGGPIARKRKGHDSAFPPELVKHFIKIYTKEEDTVLDPFMGVGTTADACQLLNRKCIGFEINPRFYELALEGIDPVDFKNSEKLYDAKACIYKTDCLKLEEYVEHESVHLTITSPPYADLLHKVAEYFAGYTYEKSIYKNNGRKLNEPYSEFEEDFGNSSLEQYLARVENLMGILYKVTVQGGFNVWVVRDFRDVRDHIPYVNLHSKIIDASIRNNWVLVDIVIWDQTNQRKLVKLGGSKSRRFYFNIGHSYILIFRKNIKGEKFKNV